VDDLLLHEMETTPHPLVAQARSLKLLLYAVNLLAVIFAVIVGIDVGYWPVGFALAAWMTSVTACVAWLLERWEESA
jgi:hypothetical protein